MSDDSAIAICAAKVERGDPVRFQAVMAAPVAVRRALLPLYAFNLELAQAPWVSKEPMIAEMRLQWWRDAVEDIGRGTIRAHEVMPPVAALVAARNLPLEVLDRMAAARRWDIYSDAFEDQAAMDAYLDDTAGGLMLLTAKALGAADPQDEAALRAFGSAAGLASYLQAVPDLVARGRIPLLDGRDQGVRDLAQRGLQRIATARAAGVSAVARPALLAGWQAEALLRLAVAEPGRVGEGRLHLSEFSRRGRLLWAAFSGRW
ncbi:squalene/phytoene synthase family protein [Pseudorhodobacter sp.]|uniref:phytoene/squalene synthase family protein n=1 Tax=Pseudorhodobacter sp. TaxID=1934400 RepID=UPI002648C090|nr:squalene/phytoene synthase family protein [Pseudorhodobacter sp.]MDN5786093.1 squalene/phytoene synthase family protein [Pseudorhodobacter sp.]